MGISERKERERKAKRKLIKDVTRQLLLNGGLDSFSLQHVADIAEISKASIYLYFEKKEDILLEILEESTDRFIAHMEESLKPHMQGVEALNFFWKSFVDYFSSKDELFILPLINHYLDTNLFTAAGTPYNSEKNPTFRMEGMIARIIEQAGRGDDVTLLGPVDEISRYMLLLITVIISNAAILPRQNRSIELVFEDIRKACSYLIDGSVRAAIPFSFQEEKN